MARTSGHEDLKKIYLSRFSVDKTAKQNVSHKIVSILGRGGGVGELWDIDAHRGSRKSKT
jgi:hypothetical protein